MFSESLSETSSACPLFLHLIQIEPYIFSERYSERKSKYYLSFAFEFGS